MKNRKSSPFIIYIIAMCLIMTWVSGLFGDGTDGLTYSEVVSLFQNEQVKSFEVQDDIIALELHAAYNGKTSLTASIGDADQFREEMNALFLNQKAAGILETYHFYPESGIDPYDFILPIILAGGVLLLICMDVREYRILSNGFAGVAIDPDDISKISDEIVKKVDEYLFKKKDKK